MAIDAEDPQNSIKKGSDKKIKRDKEHLSQNSFVKNLRDSLTGNNPADNQKPTGDKSSKRSSQKSVADKSADNISDKAKKQEETIPQNPEEDPAIYFINNLKDHERIVSLRTKKNTIIKIVGSLIGIILILIGVVYSFGPTQQVASNVIFGERAMFSVFLILVGFLILAAVFASRLLEGRFLKNISHELEIVEGKNQENDKKYNVDQKNERTNKKNK